MNKKQTTRLAFSLLFLAQATWALPLARAGFDLKDTVDSKGDTGEGDFGRKKLTLTSDIRFGYDDNPLAQPDSVTVIAAGRRITLGEDIRGSAFVNADVGASYALATNRFTLTIAGDVGFNYYFDREGRNYDINGALTLRSTYKISPRLFLEVTSYNAYVSNGDYGATNLTGFNTVLGQSGRTSADINGDYFYTTSGFGLTYQFTRRISLVTGGNVGAFAYEDRPYTTDENRIELYFSEEFRYLLLPQLTLTADYRFGYIDYFSVNNDSYTNFLLGGVDYAFGPRLRATVNAGVEFRTYEDVSSADETSPYAEATISYKVARQTTASFVARYGIEEGDLSADATKADTIRLGINIDQQITPRISVYGGFYFTHSYYATPRPHRRGAAGGRAVQLQRGDLRRFRRGALRHQPQFCGGDRLHAHHGDLGGRRTGIRPQPLLRRRPLPVLTARHHRRAGLAGIISIRRREAAIPALRPERRAGMIHAHAKD